MVVSDCVVVENGCIMHVNCFVFGEDVCVVNVCGCMLFISG